MFQPWDTTEVWIADLNEAGTALLEGSARKVWQTAETVFFTPVKWEEVEKIANFPLVAWHCVM